LESEYPGQVVAQNIDATTPKSKQICQDLGFANHGLVIRNAQDEVLWKQPDHDVKIEDVRVALKGLVGE
jgi:hypothetical protein